MSTAAATAPAARMHNRLSAVALHSTWFSSVPIKRLAEVSGVSRSAISRLLRGKVNANHSTVCKVVSALERDLNIDLPWKELFSETGSYPTASICQLITPGFRCIPPHFVDRDGTRLNEFAHIRQGEWKGDVCDGKHYDEIESEVGE